MSEQPTTGKGQLASIPEHCGDPGREEEAREGGREGRLGWTEKTRKALHSQKATHGGSWDCHPENGSSHLSQDFLPMLILFKLHHTLDRAPDHLLSAPHRRSS